MVADEDAGLSVGVVEIGFAVWAVEEVGDEFAGYFWVFGYGDLDSVDGWILKRSNFAD